MINSSKPKAIRVPSRRSALQQKTKNNDDAACPRELGTIGRGAEKSGYIGDHSARASELIKALDRRLSGQWAVKVLPPDDRSDGTNYAEEYEPRTHPSRHLASHLGDLGFAIGTADQCARRDGLLANLNAWIHPHTPIGVPHRLSARPIARRRWRDIHERWWRIVARTSGCDADNGPGCKAAQ